MKVYYKPIKGLELRYPMTQFLIMFIITHSQGFEKPILSSKLSILTQVPSEGNLPTFFQYFVPKRLGNIYILLHCINEAGHER